MQDFGEPWFREYLNAIADRVDAISDEEVKSTPEGAPRELIKYVRLILRHGIARRAPLLPVDEGEAVIDKVGQRERGLYHATHMAHTPRPHNTD